METQKLTGKLARWAVLLQEYEFKEQFRAAGTENKNADYLSRYPQPAEEADGIIPDWGRGDYNIGPEAYFAFMARRVENESGVGERSRVEIWEDTNVLDFLRTHKDGEHLGVLERDRVYRRVTQYRWLGGTLYKERVGKGVLLIVPKPEERLGLVVKVHEGMGHYGLRRVVDILEKTYWWGDLGEQVAKVVKACLPCSRVKAQFQE